MAFFRRLISRNTLNSELDQQNRDAHNAIEQNLHAARLEDEQRMSLLILGSGDSGKSTLMKQIRSIHANGLAQSELHSAKPFIFRALAESFFVLLELRDIFVESFSTPDRTYIHLISMEIEPNPPDELEHKANDETPFVIYDEEAEQHFRVTPQRRNVCESENTLRRALHELRATDWDIRQSTPFFDITQQMYAVWQLPEIQDMHQRRNELLHPKRGSTRIPSSRLRALLTTPCMDTVGYYMSRIDEYGLPLVGREGYTPSFDDYVHLRMPTTGVNRADIRYEDSNRRVHNILFTDVGGQRNERKKWMHVFDGVTAICWVVSLSEYDQVLYEDAEVQRFDESLRLFTKTVKNETFLRTNFIVFLNKSDLFEKKLERTAFPFGTDAEVPNRQDKDCIVNYIRELYGGVFNGHTKHRGDRYVAFYETNATDTKIVEHATQQVFAALVMKGFARMGM